MNYVVDILTLMAITTVAIHGYMLIKGLGGLMHLGHPVFYGVGAYTSAILTTRLLGPGMFLPSVALGALAAMTAAALVGIPALRERGRYFMIVTFAVQLIFLTIVINLGITGGPDGISGIPRIGVGPWQLTNGSTFVLGDVHFGPEVVTLLVAVLFAACSFLVCRAIIESPFGRAVRATRDDELPVEACGRHPERLKLGVFMLGAGVTGMAGSVFAHYFNYVGPAQFELEVVVLFLMMLILGGQNSLLGATVGACVTILLLEALRFVLEDVVQVPFSLTAHMREIVFSALLIGILFLRPAGIVGAKRMVFSRGVPRQPGVTATTEVDSMRRRISGRDVVHEFKGASPMQILRCESIAKDFGGVSAVRDCTMSLKEKSVVAIVGPNGAGKTTVFNIVSGFVRPDAGKVLLGDRDITGRSAVEIANMGIVRSFQDVRIWPQLTVMENLLAATRVKDGENPLDLLIRRRAVHEREAAGIERAWLLLDRFDLAHIANDFAGQLSYAQKKLVSMARLLMFEPTMVLLDEPTSGVDPRRLSMFKKLIRSFVEEEGCAVCLIEHNMEVVESLSDWVVFIEEGRVLAEGPPRDVLGDRKLMDLYLGQAAVANA